MVINFLPPVDLACLCLGNGHFFVFLGNVVLQFMKSEIDCLSPGRMEFLRRISRGLPSWCLYFICGK